MERKKLLERKKLPIWDTFISSSSSRLSFSINFPAQAGNKKKASRKVCHENNYKANYMLKGWKLNYIFLIRIISKSEGTKITWQVK